MVVLTSDLPSTQKRPSPLLSPLPPECLVSDRNTGWAVRGGLVTSSCTPWGPGAPLGSLPAAGSATSPLSHQPSHTWTLALPQSASEQNGFQLPSSQADLPNPLSGSKATWGEGVPGTQTQRFGPCPPGDTSRSPRTPPLSSMWSEHFAQDPSQPLRLGGLGPLSPSSRQPGAPLADPGDPASSGPQESEACTHPRAKSRCTWVEPRLPQMSPGCQSPSQPGLADSAHLGRRPDVTLHDYLTVCPPGWAQALWGPWLRR